MLNLWHKLLPLGLLLTCVCYPAAAQLHRVGTPKYRFQNRAQVEAAVRKHKLDLRESYNIILSAKRQGMIKSAVRAYEKDLPDSPFDTPPQLGSSFALAHELLGSSVRFDWQRDKSTGLTKLSQKDGVRVTLYRDRALEAMPNSPEVLLAAAIWAMNQDRREKALNLTTRALRLAPNWAELNWWHAEALTYRLMAMSRNSREQEEPRYGALILKSLAKAEKLDPAFKQEDLIRKSMAYSYIGRHKEALTAYDAYIRYKPAYRKLIGEQSYLASRKEMMRAIREEG